MEDRIKHVHVDRENNGIYLSSVGSDLYLFQNGSLKKLPLLDWGIDNHVAGFVQGKDGILWMIINRKGVIGIRNGKLEESYCLADGIKGRSLQKSMPLRYFPTQLRSS